MKTESRNSRQMMESNNHSGFLYSEKPLLSKKVLKAPSIHNKEIIRWKALGLSWRKDLCCWQRIQNTQKLSRKRIWVCHGIHDLCYWWRILNAFVFMKYNSPPFTHYGLLWIRKTLLPIKDFALATTKGLLSFTLS